MTEMEIVLALNELDMYPATKELTEEDIKKQWKLLIRYYHPDTNDTVAFQDGEKAKKVNNAKDMLIDNLNEVNAYIRRVNNIKSEEEILREKQQQAAEEFRRKQQQAAEEFRRKQQEEAYKKAQEEAKRQSTYNSSSSSGSTYSYNQSSTNYNSYSSSSTSSSANKTYNNYDYNYSYKAETKPVKKERKFNLIFKFTEMLIAIVCVIIAIASKKAFEIQTGGTPLFAYIIVFALPIIILTVIPKTRRQLFTYFVNSFLLFAEVIMTLALFE